MDLYYLAANCPLTKTYTKLADGSIEKTSYPDVYLVTSHHVAADTIEDFYHSIENHATQGHCLLKGTLNRPLVNESRAGSTDTTAQTQWVCLDIDGLPTQQPIDEILELLGITDTSYILQWSSSQDIFNDDLRCHVFLLLDKPTPAPLLKQWLIQLNLNTPLLSENMQLARSGNAIRWALDISTCQNDKLIFIAPPELKKVRNPFKTKSRYVLVKKKHDTFSLPKQLNSVAINKAAAEKRKQELRAKAGLPAKKSTYKTYKETEVLSRPDAAIITVARVGDQFTYVNLNGGDSAAYFHPNNNPDVIYNFKGEPNYLTKELDLDYWEQVRARCKQEEDKQAQADADQIQAASLGAYTHEYGPILLAFRDRKTGVYYHGTYDEATEDIDLAVAKTEKQVRDFCMQFDMPIGDYIPIWDLVFDPQDTIRVDLANKTINMFQRTQYMRAEPKRVQQCPPTIFKVVNHALGGEETIVEHFINWLAFIVQNRTRTETAWVMYGVEGTGKGMLMKSVLRPMLGLSQTRVLRAEQLMQPYNKFMLNTLLVFYDEAHIPNMKDPELVMEKLRNFITEEQISMRAMYANEFEIDNYTNHILASNKPNVITLTPNDRRWNIGRFQHNKLKLSKHEVHTIRNGDEIQDFYHFLYNYPADEDAARTPLVTEDRQQLIDTTLSSADEVAAALDARAACMEFFLNQLPTDNNYMSNAASMNRVEDYRAVLLVLLERTLHSGNDGSCKIARDELRALFEYTVGNMPPTPNKFTKYLAHRHIHTTKVWIDRPVAGITIQWRDHKQFKAYLDEHFPVKAKKEKVK